VCWTRMVLSYGRKMKSSRSRRFQKTIVFRIFYKWIFNIFFYFLNFHPLGHGHPDVPDNGVSSLFPAQRFSCNKEGN
jgi:hypothetical protein